MMDDEDRASWSMHWDDDGNPVGADRTEPPSLSLAPDMTFVARIVGEPSPRVREQRVTVLSASDSGALVTRLEDGSFLWNTDSLGDSAIGSENRSMPDDSGGECSAMFDSWHLIEWFNCTGYRYDDGLLTGTAEYYGPFEAIINEQFGFVTHVDVGVGTPERRRLIEVRDWRMVENDPGLLSRDALDLRSRFS